MASRWVVGAIMVCFMALGCSEEIDADRSQDDGGWDVLKDDVGHDAVSEQDIGPGQDTGSPDIGSPDIGSPDASEADATEPLCAHPEPDTLYVGSPESCLSIFYTCEPGWQPFEDQCGCGCKRNERGELCRAMDAKAQGLCEAEIGVIFDGTRCYMSSGCSCEGADCDRLYESVEQCESATGDCDLKCGDPDSYVCDVHASIDPQCCPDGSVYTIINCEPLCVDKATCSRD